MKTEGGMRAEIAKMFGIILVGAKESVVRIADDINPKLLMLLIKWSPGYAALVHKRHQQEISNSRFDELLRIESHKLVGEYNAALLILQSKTPLDRDVFESVIMNDLPRRAIFKMLEGGKLSPEDYLKADSIRVRDLLDLYGAEILRRQKNNDPILDKTQLLLA